MSDVAPSRPRLSQEELAVWRDFLVVHAAVTRRLEADLQKARDLPLGWYDVLVQLVEAPQRRLRMTELAERVLLSRSGLTRLIDRMVAAGLVERQPCVDDARGSFTAMTDAGFARLRGASSVHLSGVAEHMMAHIKPDELAVLGPVLERIRAVHLTERAGNVVTCADEPAGSGERAPA